MILTQQHIQRLISNHSVVQVLPELLPYVEELKALRSTLSRKGGCSSCKERSQIEPILTKTQNFIIGLGKDRIDVLANFLGAGKSRLYYWRPQSDGKPGLVLLN